MLDVDAARAGRQSESHEGPLVHTPAAEEARRPVSALENRLEHHRSTETLEMAAVARPHEQIEQRSGLRAEFPAPTGAVIARGGDELRGDVLSGAHGMNLQCSMTHADGPADRDRDRVVDVQASRTGGRDHLAVPVEEHGPSVDPVCEFGDDACDTRCVEPASVRTRIAEVIALASAAWSTARSAVSRGYEQFLRCVRPHDRG